MNSDLTGQVYNLRMQTLLQVKPHNVSPNEIFLACVCVFVGLYIYIYMCMYVCMYVCMYMYFGVCVCVYIYLCVYMCICTSSVTSYKVVER